MIADVFLAVVCLAAAGTGTFLGLRALPSLLRSVPVEVEVIGLEETEPPGDSPGPAFAPVFRVIGGAHDGREWRSQVVAGPTPLYEVGTRLQGQIDPRSGRIETGATRTWYWGIAVLLVLTGYGGLLWRLLG